MSHPDGIDFTSFLDELRDVLGPAGLLTDAASRLVYSRDASHLTLGRPLGVALPADSAQLRRVIRLCKAAKVSVVCRGTGTGLSGGAVPREDSLVLGTGRLTRMDAVDPTNRRVRVEPGVLNDAVTVHGSPHGLHFAPDPSSQAAASIGGNVAENAGGPHCLRHGVTLKHLRHLEWTDSGGRSLATGRGLSAERGLDLVSLLCGSEGTLGVVTSADLNLITNPTAEATLLAFFSDLEDSARAVVGLLGDGLAPVAVEIVDQAMLLAVEEAFGFGFPTDVEAAMIVEFAGLEPEVREDCTRASELLAAHGAGDVRQATDAAERTELWKCRKKAFGAVGRLAPSYVTMDVVVPLGELPPLVKEIQVIKNEHGVEVATAFHAGDGNLHPGVHYDDRDPEQTHRAHAAADAIIRAALDREGSVTGEHGVGIEKLHALPWMIDGETARLQRGIKDIFDPGNILNPGKLLPNDDAEFARLKECPAHIDFRWDNLTVSAPAEASLPEIQQAALARGFWIPVGAIAEGGIPGLGRAATVGALVENLWAGPALCPAGNIRDYLLELWAVTGDGRAFHAGAPVFKNVAGYDLVHMLCGSGQVFARPLGATFQLRPVPAHLGFWSFDLPGIDKSPEVLNRVVSLLADREDSLGGPVLVADARADSQPGRIHVLAPGREREWDLGLLGDDLVKCCGGNAPVAKNIFPFAIAPEILTGGFLPDWSLASPDWNVLARSAAEKSGPLLPALTERWIWQATGQLVWTPDTGQIQDNWFRDEFCQAGQVMPPEPPGPGVPIDFLGGLKNLFDPDGNFETPAWLEAVDG